MEQDEIDRMAAQVHELCSDRRMSDIRIDLQKTRSAEITINRILDGGFLEGTARDPSLLAHIIVESEDEEETHNDQLAQRPTTVPSQRRERRHSSPAVELPSSPLEPQISTPARTAVQRQISIHSSPDQPRTKTTTTRTTRHNDDHDDDNDSLPSLDALITKMTDKEERHIDTIELDETPPRKYDALTLLDARDETEGSLSRRRSLDDLLKEWEDDLEEEEADQQQQQQRRLPSRSSKRSRSSSRSDTGKERKTKKRKSPSAEIDYLRQWDPSSNDEDDDEDEQELEGQSSDSRGETAKERRERLKKEKAQQRKEQQEAKKEAKKAERERAKQEKKAEKERKKMFEHANKLRTNRHELLAEMILDVQPAFACSTRGELLKQVIEPKEAQVHVVDTGLHTIGWRRKTQATWDEEQGSFIPYPDNQVRIIQEPYVLVFMDMQQLCTLVNSTDMDTQIDRIQNCAGASRKILLMIEGLETYYKKKSLLIQRDFNSAVLENLGQADAVASASGSGSRKRASTAKNDPIMEAARTGPTKCDMEEKLTYLQMMKNVRLIPTVDQADSVDWIVALTADIANAMYKNRNIKFFKHQGPAKSGTDAADSWFKMLQEIQLCTPAVARAITSAYPNLPSLHHAFQRTHDIRDKQELLSDLEVERSVLSQRDRTINMNMSKKIYTIFTCTDDQHYIA